MDLDKEQSLNANWYVGDLGWYFFLNSCWTSEQVKRISCAVRSEILKFKSEDIEGQELLLLLNLKELHVYISACNTCRKCVKLLKTILIMYAEEQTSSSLGPQNA